ncbi:hypothetical protein L599_000800000090 [Luteimonas sp. J16]|jgi:hypothetical protein|uniref:hypothetical protein n=1 Tax=unclassified Luteimonas TaxID=2629088 RepID=UPI00047E143F|nr:MULTISPECIES: hypothetical protein [unclassified Luteimonas]TWG86129.1 hypothetical protein L599_000800000090 [Luteimonas sp. J16]
MNRKLRNTILAFSVTGMVLVVGLMAAHPVMPGQPAHGPDVAEAPARPAPAAPESGPGSEPALAVDADAVIARIQAHGRRPEAVLVDPRSIEQVATLTVELVTAAVAAGLQAAQAGDADAEPAEHTAHRDAAAHASKPGSHRSRSVRREIAVPYFSFARGTGDRS